jgi:hypothetical protein
MPSDRDEFVNFKGQQSGSTGARGTMVEQFPKKNSVTLGTDARRTATSMNIGADCRCHRAVCTTIRIN